MQGGGGGGGEAVCGIPRIVCLGRGRLYAKIDGVQSMFDSHLLVHKNPPPPLPGHWTPEVHAGGGSVHTLAGGHVFGVHHVFGNVDTGCTGNPVLGGPVLSVMLYVCGTDLQPHSPLYSQVWAQPGGLW